jgi:hypothetical protein
LDIFILSRKARRIGMLKADCEILSEYNIYMNKNIYTAAMGLDDPELHLIEGHFLALLSAPSTIFSCGLIWLRRFAEHPAQFKSPVPLRKMPLPKALNEIMHIEVVTLSAQREVLDNAIWTFARELTDEVLVSTLSY